MRRMIMEDIVNVARYIVHISYKREKYSLTYLKLQKILYLVNGWSYIWDDMPVFQSDFIYGKTGPISPKIHELFSKYAREEIPICEDATHLLSHDAEETIEAVWKYYGRKSMYDITEIARRLVPDRQKIREGDRISDEKVKEIFDKLYVGSSVHRQQNGLVPAGQGVPR